MKRMTSYQRRKHNILYLRQCVKELEAIADSLAKQLVEAGVAPRFLLGGGQDGNDFITYYNSGEYGFQMSYRHAPVVKQEDQ